MKRTVLQLVIAAIVLTATFPSTATSTSGATGAPVETPTCKVCDRSAGEASGSISFDVDVKQSGTYILKLWQCPAMLPSGNLQSYTISVNDKILQNDLTPLAEGWGPTYQLQNR